MASNLALSLISAAAGAACAGGVGYITWRVRRPLERRDSLIQKKMNDRWDAYVGLRSSLAEMQHACEHILRGHVDYVEHGRRHRQQARERARASVPLLGEAVTTAVMTYTDLCEALFVVSETGADVEDNMQQQLYESRRHIDDLLTEALKSLPRA